jgi:hypothetical protein
MATRFILEGPRDDAINAPFSAEWDYTDEWTGPDILLHEPTGSGTADSWFQVNDTTAASNRDSLMVNLYSLPFSEAGTLGGTVKGQALVRENFFTTNALRSQTIVKVISNDGSVTRGVAYPGDDEELTGEPTSKWRVGTFENRRLIRAGTVALDEVAYEAGDRLIVEIGFRKHTTDTGS